MVLRFGLTINMMNHQCVNVSYLDVLPPTPSKIYIKPKLNYCCADVAHSVLINIKGIVVSPPQINRNPGKMSTNDKIITIQLKQIKIFLMWLLQPLVKQNKIRRSYNPNSLEPF